MKKLILIDDNSKNQREAYGASYVDEERYGDCLLHIEHLNGQSDLSFLDDAECVMMHDSLEDFVDGSFCPDGHRAKDRIEQIVNDRNIPYASFSDGHALMAKWNEESPFVINAIKKSEFYLHLEAFIQAYKSTGSIDMRILAYGKDYLKILVSHWVQTIFACLSNVNDADTIDMAALDTASKRAIRLVLENAQPKVGITFNELMASIEDEEITAGQLRSNINNIICSIKKYGKNISRWK